MNQQTKYKTTIDMKIPMSSTERTSLKNWAMLCYGSQGIEIKALKNAILVWGYDKNLTEKVAVIAKQIVNNGMAR